MPDTSTVQDPVTHTSVTDEKPDFYFGKLQGLIPEGLDKMHAQGQYANNFSMGEPEEYWGKKTVKAAFTMPDGSERKDLFDESYKNTLSEFKAHKDVELNLVNFLDQFPTVTAERVGAHTHMPELFKTKLDPSGRDYTSGLAFTDAYSERGKSLRELAIDTGVKTGKGYTPTKDFSGDAKFALDDKGQILFNEDNQPYLVPLKDGEQLHQWDSIYSPVTKWLGGYGYDYSWGNLAASIPKNLINAFARSIDDVIEYGRGLMDVTGLSTPESRKAVNKAENWAKGMEIPSTEKNQDSILNVENTIDISQQALIQLAGMYGVGAAVTALTKNPKAGAIAGRIFMTAISAGYMAEVARDNNLTKNESALLLGLTTFGIWKLMPLEEAVLGKLKTNESTAGLIDMLHKDPNINMQVVDAVRSPSPSKLRSLTRGITEAVKTFTSSDKFRSTVFKLENAAPILVGAGGEAVEEFAEQGLDLAVRAGYSAYSNAFDDSKHPFKMDLYTELSQLGQAALGGAIGGSVAHGAFARMLKNHPEEAQTWHDMIMDGKEQTLRDFTSRMHAQGRFDHDWLTPAGKIAKPTTGESRNDSNRKVVDGITDYLVELRDASGIKDLAKNNMQAAKGLFSEVIASSSVGKDAADLSRRIVAVSDELEKAKLAKTPNSDLISQKTEELKLNQDALQKIVKGDFVADYVTEGLYNTDVITSRRVVDDPGTTQEEKDRAAMRLSLLGKLTGKEFNALLNGIPEAHKAAVEAHQQATQAQEATDQAATVESPAGASEAQMQILQTQAQADYADQYKNMEQHFEALSKVADEEGEPLVSPADFHPGAAPDVRELGINILKNNILPSLPAEAPLRKGIESLTQAASILKKVEETQGVQAPDAPSPTDDLLRMTTGKGALIASSPSTIPDKVGEELALRNASIANGVSLYSNSPQLKAIKSSIEARIAQTLGILSLYPKLTSLREAHSLPSLPETDQDQLVGTLAALEGLLGVTNNLLAESEDNTASADMKVAQAVGSLLRKSMDYMDALSVASIGTTYAGIQPIVAQARPAINKALDDNKLVEVMRLMSAAETAIYHEASAKRDEILTALSKAPYSEAAVRTYDYARGILSLSSADFWNAYSSVLSNSNAGIFSPSDEHAIIAKQAVQGLMADQYAPPIPELRLDPGIRHHNSVFIEGRGGTAKTKTIIPLVAGIVQHLQNNPKGQVFLTAAADVNDFKRTTLVDAVETFYQINDRQLGINVKNSSLGILEFLSSPGATTDVDLIVYDEATLLSSDRSDSPEEGDLRKIQREVDRINKQRRETDGVLLKVLYTGDTLQNSKGVDKNNPDSRPLGIDDVSRHIIQRTPALTFSFRQSNQQLTLFSAYLQSIQVEKGTSRPFSTEYKSREGVQIHQGYADFITNALSHISSLAKQNRLHEAVYITDKGSFEVDQRIIDSGILRMTSENAQGREWPTVFFDPKNTRLFTPDFTNVGVKKDYYTAATRASNYLLTHVLPGQGITSTEGTVNKVRPLTPEAATRAATIERVNQIIGDLAAPVSKVAFNYTKSGIVEDGGDFPAEFTPQQEQPAPTSQEPVDTSKPIEPGPLAAPVRKVTTPLTKGSNIYEYLQTLGDDGTIPLYTFYTDELRDLETQMGLKRKALFDINTRKTIPYFLSINRIGSPGYENVLRNNPEFDGDYALFIEAGAAGNHVVLGTLDNKGLDKAIKEGNLLQGRQSVRIPLLHDGEFLTEARTPNPDVVNKLKKTQTLGDFKAASKGIRFGTPYIVMSDRAETNIKGKPKAAKGQVFIPASFYHTSDMIADTMYSNNSTPYITKIPVRMSMSSFQEIVAVLEPLMEDGKFTMNAKDNLPGRMYDAFWSHNTESGDFATGKKRINRVSQAFQDAQQKVSPSDPFYEFLDKYIEKPIDPRAEEIIETISNGTDFKSAAVTDNTRYFLKHYLEAKDKGQTKQLHNFERAITALESHPFFRQGFEFNPRIKWKSTDRRVNAHAQAVSLPEEVYNKYLHINADYASPPVLRLSTKQLLRAIKDATPQAVQQPAETKDKAKPEATPTTVAEIQTPGGQSLVEYTEPTISTSSVAATTDQNPVSDNVESEVASDEDRSDGDSRDAITMERFIDDWFDYPGFTPLLTETIRRFRRGFMDRLFSVNAEDGAQPFLRDIDSLMKEMQVIVKEQNKEFTDDFMDDLDPINDEHERELYTTGVIYREFPFLVKKYFPAVKLNEDKDSANFGKYEYRSSHYKNRSFSEKESFNALAEGTTDMVKSLLYNTPILRRVSEGVFETTNDFVWQDDIENLVKAVRGSTSTDDVAAHFRENPNQAVQSVYYKFFHTMPYVVDGKSVWPIGKIANKEVFKMRDSVAQKILSDEVFDLTRVDLDEERLKAAWGPYGNPSNVIDTAHNSVLQVAETTGKSFQEEGNGMVAGQLFVRSSTAAYPATDEEVLAAIHAIGLPTFTAQNLRDVQKLDFETFNLTPSGDAAAMAQKVNNKIIDDIILPTMRKMASDSPLSFRTLRTLYGAIARTSGISSMTMQRDVAGNRSYRYRWGAPVFRYAAQIAEIRNPSDGVPSVHTDNLIARERNPLYKIEGIRVKNGFQSWRKSKITSKMSAKEIADFDVIWSFAQMVKEGHESTSEYNLAMFTPMVWADSPTDLQMVVSTKHSLFRDPQSILKDLFESRKSLYQRHSAKILTKWGEFLGDRYHPETLQGLSSWLSANPIPVAEVAVHPGMVSSLYYTSVGGNASIKPSLVEDATFYSGNNLPEFIKRSQAHYNTLLEFSNASKDADGRSMTTRLGEVLEGKSGEAVLKAFYYNWLTFSGEFTNMTAGITQAYKGDTESKEYIDNTKRNKLEMANRSSMLYRNYSWNHLWHQSKVDGVPLSEELRYEGKKLPRHARVAYIDDPKVLLSLPNGLQKWQEVWDGATFVPPTTRIMQRHSNSGSHGMYVGAVMKNVTTIYDNTRGVTTGVKNAEFLMTPELMVKGTTLLASLVKRAYMHPFSAPIQGEGQVLSTPWDYLVSKGMAEDLSNATWERFEDLMDFLVENGQQDSLITEIIPSSSRKMGGDAINSHNAETPFVVGEKVDLVNKGTQLDASHGTDEIKSISASQIINAMAVNWPSHPWLMRIYNGLAEIANAKIAEFKSMTPAKRITYLKAIATESFSKRPDMSYASRVTSPMNSNNFSIDDRQLTKTIIQNLNSELTDDAVLLDFEGGQFIVHPTNGLIHVYDVVRDGKSITVLKDELEGEEKTTAVGRDLKWNGADGYAEILLPASMRKKFGIKPGTILKDITPEYFLSLMKDDKKSPVRAKALYDSFQITLRHMVTRIPATGKHSAVSSRVVGFIHDSENAIFPPAELLFVQGADQDADKGTNFSYEAINGIIPEVDDGFELVNKKAFSEKRHKEARIVGIKNAIVHAMEQIQLLPATMAERNTPVDAAKKELEDVAAPLEATYKFSRDSYVSHLQMREINQAGMALRGIFSNAMKTYNIMTIAYRAKGIDPQTMGLSTDPKVPERLGALVNAAVDNAKDQLMGKLGIGEHNANMIAYLVMTNGPEGRPRTFKEIHNILLQAAPQMEQMKDFRRYDSPFPFRADVQWAGPKLAPLATIEYFGNELSTLARVAINRQLPSSDTDMIKFRKDIETFVNNQYKVFGLDLDFKLVPFLSQGEYNSQQVTKYQGLQAREKDGIRYSRFNILRVLNDAPHIASYMQVYLLSHKMAGESKFFAVASRLADEVMNPNAQLDTRGIRIYNDMKEFTYSLFIDQYLQKAENPTKFDLASPLGRAQFVETMGDTSNKGALARLKTKYPNNTFVQALSIVPDKKRGWEERESTLLRLFDLQMASEERRMQMQADFGHLDKKDRKTMFLYNLITRHTRFGKDSFGTLLSPGDKADFTKFLDRRLDTTSYKWGRLKDLFNAFRSGNLEGMHNAVPYSAIETRSAPMQKPEEVAQTAGVEALTTKPVGSNFNTRVHNMGLRKLVVNNLYSTPLSPDFKTGLREQAFRIVIANIVENPMYLDKTDLSMYVSAKDNDRLRSLRPMAEEFAKINLQVSGDQHNEKLVKRYVELETTLQKAIVDILGPYLKNIGKDVSFSYENLRDVDLSTAVQLAKPSEVVTVSQASIDLLNSLLEGGKPYTVKTPVANILQGVEILLTKGALNPMETAYLKGLKQDILSKRAPDAKTVDKRTKDCS